MIANDASRRSKIRNVIRVSSGNFLEMYDFIVFGYYAAAIGRTFFPGNSPSASLMLSHVNRDYAGEVRTAGFSLAYSLATAVFGGFTPAICTYLINVTGNRAMPGVWMSCAAALGLIGAIIANPTQVVAQTNRSEADRIGTV